MPNADVFISYRRDQREQVQLIAQRLQELGLSVWFDARLEAGVSFDEEINREVRSAKAVLVCWTPEAVQSRWVRAEASIGLERDVLVAAFLMPTELIPPYNLVHAANLQGWRGEQDGPAWREVLARVGKLTGRPQLAEEARARAKDSQWVQQDQTDRERFEAAIEEARRRFVGLHQSRPTAFEQSLTDLRSDFEGWILRRRMGNAGAAPNPLRLVEDQADALRTELEIAQRERDAALVAADRAKNDPAPSRSGARSYWGAVWRAITVLVLGPIAMSLWGMKRLASLWVLIFVIVIPALALQGCGQVAYSGPEFDVCYNSAERRWERLSYDYPFGASTGEVGEAPVIADHIAGGTVVLHEAQTPSQTCEYWNARRESYRRGQSEMRSQALGIFAGIAVLENFGFALFVLGLGLAQAALWKRRAKQAQSG